MRGIERLFIIITNWNMPNNANCKDRLIKLTTSPIFSSWQMLEILTLIKLCNGRYDDYVMMFDDSVKTATYLTVFFGLNFQFLF